MIFNNIARVAMIVGLAALTGFFSSCEKAVLDETTGVEVADKNANLIIRLKGSQVDDSFQRTRAMQNITDYCSRFNFVLYKDGQKVKGLSQKKGDADYGQVSMTLAAGTYKLLVLAHSSTGGNPTLSDPENIKFTNALGYTDTFYYYGDIEVTAEQKTHDVVLKRAVTRVFFVINDELPDDVAFIKYEFTGGSGVLNAVTGYGGSVNSRQEKFLDVSAAAAPVRSSLYTFLQEDTGAMQLTVTALKSDKETEVKQLSFSDIPVEYGKETIVEGEFFDHYSDNNFSFQAETDWETLQTISY